jgi:hypothetical protein
VVDLCLFASNKIHFYFSIFHHPAINQKNQFGRCDSVGVLVKMNYWTDWLLVVINWELAGLTLHVSLLAPISLDPLQDIRFPLYLAQLICLQVGALFCYFLGCLSDELG